MSTPNITRMAIDPGGHLVEIRAGNPSKREPKPAPQLPEGGWRWATAGDIDAKKAAEEARQAGA